MGKVRDALNIADDVDRTDLITEEMQARPGYQLYAATGDKLVQAEESGQIALPPTPKAFNRKVRTIIQEAAEAAMPDWKRTSSGDFEKSFDGGAHHSIGTREADKAQWLLEQLGVEHIREGNGFMMSAEENKKVRDESKGLRLGMAGRLPL